MFPFLASALLSLRRNPVDEPVELDADPRPRVPPLTLGPPLSIPAPMMTSDPSPISRSLTAMLKVLGRYVLPPFLQPPPPSALPPASVLLASVVERTVGLGSRVGTDTRGPFSVAALKGLRVEAVVRYEVWGHTSAEVGPFVEDLIKHLLGDRELLRAEGFLRLTLKSAGASENIFAEDAFRQHVEFDVLFEFPYVDSDDAESLIARIPINLSEEFNEATTVTDEMVRWDDEPAPPPLPPSTPPLVLRGVSDVGLLSALAFIPGTAPTGKVTLTRTFDGAAGLPTVHPNLSNFLAAVTDPNSPERHAQFTFGTLSDFLAAFDASFKITNQSLANLKTDNVPDAVLEKLQNIKEREITGKTQFVELLKITIGLQPTIDFQALILKHAARPFSLGNWNNDNLPDEYQSLALTISPAIKLPGAVDRFEITYETPVFDQVGVVYLRATRGETT